MKAMLVPTFLALLAAVPALAPSASPPALGPGAVLDMHQALFRALDEGDAGRLENLLASVPSGATWSSGEGWGAPQGFLAFGPGGEGSASRAASVEDGRELLLRWAGERGWQTRITQGWTDCASAEISYAVLELERTRRTDSGERIERFRSTSLVSHRNGRWVIWHFHLSRV